MQSNTELFSEWFRGKLRSALRVCQRNVHFRRTPGKELSRINVRSDNPAHFSSRLRTILLHRMPRNEPRRYAVTSLRIELACGSQRELPRIPLVGHELLQDTSQHWLGLRLTVFDVPGYRGRISKTAPSQELADLEIRVDTGIQFAEDLQDEPVAIKDGAIVLFRLGNAGAEDRLIGPENLLEGVGAPRAQVSRRPFERHFPSDGREESIGKRTVFNRLIEYADGSVRQHNSGDGGFRMLTEYAISGFPKRRCNSA